MSQIKIKKDKCKSCELCIFYCPTKHLQISKDLNKRGLPYAQIRKETHCAGCGLCFLICPETCIEVYE